MSPLPKSNRGPFDHNRILQSNVILMRISDCYRMKKVWRKHTTNYTKGSFTAVKPCLEPIGLAEETPRLNIYIPCVELAAKRL
jgi:hypothetical protein